MQPREEVRYRVRLAARQQVVANIRDAVRAANAAVEARQREHAHGLAGQEQIEWAISVQERLVADLAAAERHLQAFIQHQENRHEQA